MKLETVLVHAIRRHLLPPRLVLSMLFGVVALRLYAPGPSLLPVGWAWIGAMLALVGLGLTLYSARQFAAVETNIKTFDAPDKLVDWGGFGFSRNPMYLGFALLLVGTAAAVGGTFTFVPPLLFVLFAEFVYIPFEERAMSQRFGAAYDAYQRRVRRWC